MRTEQSLITPQIFTENPLCTRQSALCTRPVCLCIWDISLHRTDKIPALSPSIIQCKLSVEDTKAPSIKEKGNIKSNLHQKTVTYLELCDSGPAE